MNDTFSIGVVCYPSLGGSGVVASELATGLAERGHRVHVIASARPSRGWAASERLSYHEVLVSDYPLFEHPPYTVAVAAKIAEVAARERLDLVHVHYAVPHAASAYLARQALGGSAPRVVTTLHGTDVTHFGADPIARFSVAASDGVTVPSQFLRHEASRLLELGDDFPLQVIPNFVDTDSFVPAEPRDRRRLEELFVADGHKTPGGPLLFHVSNFRAVKRTADLMDVLAQVRKSVAARLVLVGDGPERPRAEERAKALGLADAVCFLGKQSDFAGLLQHADGFVLTSESESFGVAALEAMSAGVPVFAYRVGGLPEVVGEHGGCLTEPFDAGTLSRAIVDAVTDPTKHAALGRAARAHALEHFRRATVLDRYESYYRRILASPPRRKVDLS